MDWILTNKEALGLIILCVLRLMESVAVLAKSNSMISVLAIVKEFFRFG